MENSKGTILGLNKKECFVMVVLKEDNVVGWVSRPNFEVKEGMLVNVKISRNEDNRLIPVEIFEVK